MADCKDWTLIQPGDIFCGFELVKVDRAKRLDAQVYTMRHKKTGAELLYIDRRDENRTFSIAFKTLPEDNTGVFHILEHSVLSGSRKSPVKEPFVSLLQNSMQTFLNAMTFGDKTVFPVSSRNEQDLFNLMTVYLDGVFSPLIYDRPEIFMQEGWHYEFESEGQKPYYNGVVFSEMKGAFADVDQLMADETQCMLFPDNSYGYTSGGRPENIPDLTYEKFIETHRRFYHPSNARIFLDGHMDVEKFLNYIDEEYLSKYEYRENDFDFKMQTPVASEKTVNYEAQDGEQELAHMCVSRILCDHNEVEKLYASKILADYLTGSNDAPLKRGILERGLAQDMSMIVNEEMYQDSFLLVFYNSGEEMFQPISESIAELAHKMAEDGLDRAALRASLERMAFENREISEPYGIELAMKAYAGWLYGDDPLTYIDNADIFDSLRGRIDTGYFEDLLEELLGNADDKSYLYVQPSLTKGEQDAQAEAEKIDSIVAAWDESQMKQVYDSFVRMQEWQQTEDTEEAMRSLPHLELSDVPENIKTVDTELTDVSGVKVLRVKEDTNGIAYLNMYFDISDYSAEELQLTSALTASFGELRTENYAGDELQTRIKTAIGSLSARVEVMAKPGDLDECKPYLVVTAGVLEENMSEAAELLTELFTRGRYDEMDKIYETVMQSEYMIKQALIANGHQFAITRALSAFSRENAMKELLDGETFVRWFTEYANGFMDKAGEYPAVFGRLMTNAFARNRMFVGCSGNVSDDALESLITALPVNEIGEAADCPSYDREDSSIEIPASVGFSGFGHNLYSLGSSFSGGWAVLSSLMSFGYLWNMVRVQGGAYGTGMGTQMNGNVFVYSYRDPNLAGTRDAYCGMADFLEDFVAQGMPLDDIIIGTLNMIDPLMSPAGVCDQECVRYLKGIKSSDIARVRTEILEVSSDTLKPMVEILKQYIKNGKFCAVGDAGSLSELERSC